jgi:hypothetical protein
VPGRIVTEDPGVDPRDGAVVIAEVEAAALGLRTGAVELPEAVERDA